MKFDVPAAKVAYEYEGTLYSTRREALEARVKREISALLMPPQNYQNFASSMPSPSCALLDRIGGNQQYALQSSISVWGIMCHRDKLIEMLNAYSAALAQIGDEGEPA
jgi:hypothetical protein